MKRMTAIPMDQQYAMVANMTIDKVGNLEMDYDVYDPRMSYGRKLMDEFFKVSKTNMFMIYINFEDHVYEIEKDDFVAFLKGMQLNFGVMDVYRDIITITERADQEILYKEFSKAWDKHFSNFRVIQDYFGEQLKAAF